MRSDREPSSQGLSWALAIAGAILAGSFDANFGGVILAAVVGYLFAQVLYLRRWTSELNREVLDLRGQASGSAQPVSQEPASAGASSPMASTPVSRTAEAPKRQQPAEPVRSAGSAVLARSRTVQKRLDAPNPRKVVITSKPSLLDGLADSAIAWIKGGNPLARAGIVILFFGAAFLAKYAAEHSLFPIELRFVAIALGALALLTIGWRLRDKRPVYAQLLQGGGIAGLYLTVFAAMKLYQLLPVGLAFALMVAIVLASAVLAVAQNALPLAFIGAAGGFVAPLLVSTGAGNHIALFTYYAILNVGVFAIAWFRTWPVLNVLGFVFTFGVTALWRSSGYERSEMLGADAFLILFFLMYVSVAVLNCVRQPPNLKGYVSGSLVFGLPIVAFALHASLITDSEGALAWSALAVGGFYLGLGWILLRSGRPSFRLLVESFAALGVIFASLAIPLGFDAQTTAAMWAVEGAGLIWLGLRQARKLPRAFGALLQLGAGIAFLSVMDGLEPEQLLLNVAFLGTTMLSVSGFASSYWLCRYRNELASYEHGTSQLYALWASAWWLGGGLYQIDRFLDYAALGSALLYASISAALLAVLGHRCTWSPALRIAWWLPAVSTLAALTYTVGLEHPFAQYGALGWIGIFAIQLALLRAADQHTQYVAIGKPFLHAGTCWLLVLVLAAETSWLLTIEVGGVWPALPWGLWPALFLMLVSRRHPRPEWPIASHLHAYRFIAAVPLAILAAAWITVVNMTNNADPVWLPYLPLLNPLDVSVAIVLMALAVWWMSLDQTQRSIGGIDPRVLYAVIASLFFLWLNSALIRALHYMLDTPLSLYGISRSTVVQAALSIFWGVLGFVAMTFAARSRRRIMWVAGAVLMGVVVVKLFLLDLSSTGTVARIASFLSVGVLLLITGYLAPLPPRRTNEGVPSEA